MVDGMTAVQINVRGSHTVRLLPERATVHAALAAEGPEPQPVFDAVVAALADVKTSIEALHDPKRGPVTWYSFDQVRMGSRRPWNKDGKQLPLVHSATVSVAAKFSDFDDLATWVTWSAGVDGFGIGYIEWAPTEDRRLKVERKTRRRALRDAKRRAQDYADALELGVVTVRTISDTAMNRPVPVARMAAMRSEAPAPPAASPELSLRPEEIEISAEVEATFEIKR